MQNNYYFLKLLSKQIALRLHTNWILGGLGEPLMPEEDTGMQLATCFSQDKDELVLGFCNSGEEFYLRAVLHSDFAGLNFPQDFHRAKRNSVDLFPELLNLKVRGIVQHLNERSFSVFFEQDYQLLFKMHGRRSNLILFKENDFIIAFHKKMDQDQSIRTQTLDRTIDQSFEAWQKADYDWKTLYPTLDKTLQQYLQKKLKAESEPGKQWEIILNFIQKLDNPKFYVLLDEKLPQFSLLPPEQLDLPDDNYKIFTDPIEAANEFFYSYSRIILLAKEKNDALKLLQKKLKQSLAYIDKNLERLLELEDGSKNEETANILMANMHQIPTGQSSVELFDFYRNQTIKIKLKKELSPQKNAESYYRKAKNEKIERQTLQKNLERKEKEIEGIKSQIAHIQSISQIKELRKFLKENNLQADQQSQKADQQLFRKFHYQGFEIWVGKNAKNNDLLTQQYAYKEDLWLHAKDVSGSHVVIKYQAGKTFPSDVIEKAASLAAYYSKRSADSLCPVIVTPRKFVRKTKDLAPGQVIVEKEEVIMVSPEKF
ncbi:MAG: NFACT RNA binding domain-containing protein [Microscillaceae bacterium]|nr:NFACT RNA binding domain-containing protein [Microscillaceae bacterium]